MRPILLDLEGFCSYRTKATIDFRDADFFVLVGPTGSGKSTVIDAMVFALYGTVPRWDDRNAVAPALAPTVNRGVVRLIFEAGGKRYVAARDIRRTGSRSPTVREARLEQFVSADSVGLPDDETISIATGPRVVNTAVEQMLGLTFEQFTQSVALPQGEFARFLHATDGERQAILKNLLGYNIYDSIQKAAYSRASDADSRADTLAEQLENYTDATEVRVEAFSRALNELREFQTHVTTVAVPALKAAAGDASTARNLAGQLNSEREQLLTVTKPEDVDELDAKRRDRAEAAASAESQQAAIEKRDTQIRDLLQATTPRHELERMLANWQELRDIEDRLPALAKTVTAAVTEQQAADDKRIAADSALRAAREAATQATKSADDKQRQLQTAQEHLALVEVLEPPTDVEGISETLRNASDALAQTNSALQSSEAEHRVATDALDKLPDPTVLAAAESGIKEVHGIIAQDTAQSEDRVATEKAATRAQTDAESASNHVLVCERALRDAEHADQAAALRADLNIGDDCPVCGQTITEIASDSARDDLSAARTTIEDAKNTAQEASADVARLRSAHQKMLAVRTERLQRCDSLRSTLMLHLTNLGMVDSLHAMLEPLGPETSTEQLAALADEATSIQTQTTEAKEQRSTAEDKRRAADLAVNAARAEVRAAGEAVDVAQTWSRQALTALRGARDSVSALGPPPIDDTDIAAAWQQLTTWAKEQVDTLAGQVAALTPAAEEARTAAQQASDELDRGEAAAQKATQEHTDAAVAKQRAVTELEIAEARQSELAALLADAPSSQEAGEQLEHVKGLQVQLDEVGAQLAAARTAAADAREAATKAEAAITASWQHLRRMRDPLAGFGAPEVIGTDLSTEWNLLLSWAAGEAQARATRIEAQVRLAEEANGRADATARALAEALTKHAIEIADGLSPADFAEQAPAAVASAVATAKGQLERAHERQRESEAMRSEMKGARESAHVAQTLSNLMRAQHFPRWLIASALDALLQEASLILLELSDGQFELTRDERDLLVIDHNDADMSRPVKTLSGGETFQASLALALALSKQVTSLSTVGASKLESIFLDEGFGTLDEDTLDVVAGTLESLASSGSRMVGVITHVAALAERIPVRFQVNRDSAGSHIERMQV